MQKRFLQKCSILALSVVMTLGVGCKKESMLGHDNATAVQTPYSLYASTVSGKIIHTNDGEKYDFVFPSDGYGPSHLVVSGANLLMLKDILHYSRNEGKSFNPSHRSVRKFDWQSMMYYHAPFKRLYITTTNGRGVEYSEDDGLTWKEDIFEADLPSMFEISSFAGLQNGSLYAYSNVSNVVFVKSGSDLNWTPISSVAAYPTLGSDYYLISAGNTLYLVDYNGLGGVWMSADLGITWSKIQNNLVLPSNGDKFTGAAAPVGNKVVVVATENSGIFRSNEDGEFQKTTGIPAGTKIRALTKKINIYKNGSAKVYLYAATDQGIYRSEDQGKSWFISGGLNMKDDFSTIF